MMELFGLPIAHEAIGGICLGGAAALDAILYLQNVGPAEPEQPWRWGDAPRRPDAMDGWIGHLVGALLTAALIGAALAQALA